MKDSIKKLMREFKYEDKRISHLLCVFDDHVRFIMNYNNDFDFDNKEHESAMLAGYRNSAFGILLALLQLGHITTADFHQRMHALNSVFFKRVGY